ncbi:ankyrin repeat protein, putative [Trichomonas vaginalis G3]|uniref:Ankyrin repeat protein, putative n=1 Tax=Trichomonas vaginalis (strain ATCC PRA-98 / G3) TaxID=412133 RepID=A2FGL8_TRIV3|nr:ankyrin repeat protein, putative [Trichomonas vaginalis G3]|eukprot:XP_001308872.1 ankyrin repeat protein [Trichomonas vaginalis G3]
MSRGLTQDFEYTAAHIMEYIEDDRFFDIFEPNDIAKIFKLAKLTLSEFNIVLDKVSRTGNANILFPYVLNTNVSVDTFQEVISILSSVKKYAHYKFLNGIIDNLLQTERYLSYNSKKIDQLQSDLHVTTNEKQKFEKEIQSLRSKLECNEKEIANLNEENRKLGQNFESKEILSKIAEFKNGDGNRAFGDIYHFLDDLAQKGYQKMMSKACEEGLWEENMYINESGTILHEAARNGNLRLVKSLIDCGCDKETKKNHYNGNTPLIEAANNGHLDVVKYLISVGANKDATSQAKWTPLMRASYNGHLEVVKYLISVGANKDAKDGSGENALYYAAENGQFEMVKYLVSIGADINAKNILGETAVRGAVVINDLEILKYLISVGADKETKDDNGKTLLIIASEYGHLEIVKYLVSIGANKEAKDDRGRTPLICASKENRRKIVDYLISVGADEDAKDNDGKTALYYLSEEYQQKRVSTTPIGKGPRMSPRQIMGRSFLNFLIP